MSIQNSKNLAFLFVFLLSATSYSQMHRGWFADVTRVPGLDSPRGDWGPWVSDDTLRIYFSSDRADPSPRLDAAKMDIWMSSRSSPNDPFGEPIRLPDSINGPDEEVVSYLSRDETEMVFVSKRDGLPFNVNSFIVKRESKEDEWGEPQPFPSDFAQGFYAIAATVPSEDGLSMFFQGQEDRDDPGNLYFVDRESTDVPFNAARVTELESLNTFEFQESNQTVSSDGLAIIYGSNQIVHRPVTLELWASTRFSKDDPFMTPMTINEFGVFENEISGLAGAGATYTPFLARDWPVPGSKLYFGAARNRVDSDIYEATWHVLPLGDLTKDLETTVEDIDQLSAAVRAGTSDLFFDLNEDGSVNDEDRTIWVHDAAQSYFGDSNLDGEFNSSDLVAVFEAGEYEDLVEFNSKWPTGDWNGDGDFNSRDFVVAFQDGGYEKGPRDAVQAVPEPSGVTLIGIAMIGFLLKRCS